MTSEIVILNMRKTGQLRGFRIDRKSPLGNPFVIGVHGTREQVIQQYETWIPWAIANVLAVSQEYEKLVEQVERTEGRFELACWCDPLPCHAHVLRRMLREHLKTLERPAWRPLL